MANDGNKRIDDMNEEKMNLYAREGIRRIDNYLDMPPDSRKKADELEDLQQDTVDRERAGDYVVNLSKGGDSNTSTKTARISSIRKSGPLVISFATLLSLTGVSGLLIGPFALLAFFEKAITNHGANDTKFNVLMQRAHTGAWFSQKGSCKLAICGEITEMSEKMRARLEARGFKIEPAADGTTKRTKPTRITFPEDVGGKEVTDAKGWHAETKANYKAHVAATEAVNPKTASYIAKKAMMRKILGKYGASIGRNFKPAFDKDETERRLKMDQNIDKHTGATTGDDGVRASGIRSKLRNDTRLGKGLARVSGKITGAADLGSLACGFYTTVKVTLATIKINWYKDLLLFGLPIIQTIAAGEDQGNVSYEQAGYVTNRLLETDPNATLADGSPNPGAKKNATDSQPLQQLLFGYDGVLTDVTKLYTTWWIMGAVKGSGAVAKVEDYLGGRENVHNACMTAKAASLAGTAFCASNPFSFAICGVAIGTAIVYGDEISKWIVESITEEAAEKMARANLNSSLRYEPLGTAIVAAIGISQMEKSRSSGLKPARNSSQLKEYNVATSDIHEQYITRVAREEGKADPFNPYKEYSFAGQLATTLSPYISRDTSAFQGLANIFLMGGSAFASITPKTFASASYLQPNSLYTPQNINKLDKTLEQCEDQQMDDINFECTWYGGEMPVAEKKLVEELEKQANGENHLLEDTAQYMHDKQYIDDKGKGIGDTNPEGYEEDWTEKSEWIKYLNNCPEDRPYAIGSSTLPIDDFGEDSTVPAWDSGARCGSNTATGDYDGEETDDMINKFSVWGNLCRVTLVLENELEGPCGTEKGTPGKTKTLGSNGDWGCPVNPKAPGAIQTQPPHDIGDSTASGVDYNYGRDTPGPIYAVRDGTVTIVGPATGYGNWMHVEHEENGQKVTSYYGHIASDGFKVKVGDKVRKGDHIADIGAGQVGYSSGAHLHIGLIMPSGPSAQDYETRFMKGCEGIEIYNPGGS